MTIHPASPEDKSYWCKRGEQDERDFVAFVAAGHGLSVQPNPLKRFDPYAPDLLLDGSLADLKAQRTPFFTAERYGLDPQFTVTLNAKDLERYGALDEDLAILFWVRWDRLRAKFGRRSYQVRPLEGVWLTRVSEVLARVESGDVPYHTYLHRVDDTHGNAKASYLLDLGWMQLIPYRIPRAA
jgi:hypothetical protein